MRALVVDPEGRRIAIAAGTTHYVLDEAGDTRLALSEPGASGAIALSSGGARFARGREGGAEVYVDQGSGYAFEVDRPAGAYELATSVALSADGGVWAISWWNASDGVSSRLEVLDRASGARTNHVTQLGAGVAGLQNLPVRIALTPDGSRAAWGLWGTGDKRPEVLVVESAGGAPVLEVDLPGSVEALAFSEDGTRVAVAAKDTHANRFSTTGRVLLFDTGERDLQRVGTARPGGTLELELSTPTPCTSVFAFGFERSVPLVTGFGDVWVDFDEPHFLRSAQTVGDRASLSVPISAASSVIGLPLLVQGLRLLSSGPELATHLVRLRVL